MTEEIQTTDETVTKKTEEVVDVEALKIEVQKLKEQLTNKVSRSEESTEKQSTVVVEETEVSEPKPEVVEGLYLGADEDERFVSRTMLREKGISKDSDEAKILSEYLKIEGVNNFEDAWNNAGAIQKIEQMQSAKDAEQVIVESDEDISINGRKEMMERLSKGEQPKTESELKDAGSQLYDY